MRRGTISSELRMCGGGRRMFVFVSGVVTVWGPVGTFVV